MSILIFFDYLYFQIVKLDVLDEIVLCETNFAVALEIGNIFVQPDGPSQVKAGTDFVQSPKDLVGAGICVPVPDAGILQHAVVLEGSSP